MKKFRKVIIILIVFFGFLLKVNAGNVTISSSSSKVTVGSNVTINLNITNLSGMFRVVSSDSSILAGKAEGWCDNNVCENGMKTSIVFTAKKAGTATISVIPVDVSDNTGEGADFTSTRSLTITVVEKSKPKEIDVNKTYSKNNYLKSLSVDGYELSPKFDKEKLEYTIELEPGTEKINIKASVEDSTSSIKGAGEVSVSEGTNTISIKVTAENGNERTYKITANVDEKDPIIVKLNNEEYRVVKKEELLTDREGYTKSKVKIDDFEIPSLYNEVTKVTLVGLKDKEGNIKLVSYDSKTGQYQEYQEFSFDIMSLYLIDKKLDKYEKTKIKINEESVYAYKIPGVSDHYLLYGINTTTGNEGYYLYDIKENSIQRYDTSMLEAITKEKDKYLSLVIVLSSVCFLTMLFLLIEVNKVQKYKRED